MPSSCSAPCYPSVPKRLKVIIDTLPPPARPTLVIVDPDLVGITDSNPFRKGGYPPAHARPTIGPSHSRRLFAFLAITLLPTPRSPNVFSCNTYDFPANVANTRLTGGLSPLDATLIKNQGLRVLLPILKGSHESAMRRARLLIQVLSFQLHCFQPIPHSLRKTPGGMALLPSRAPRFAEDVPTALTGHDNLLFPAARPTINTASHPARSRHA